MTESGGIASVFERVVERAQHAASRLRVKSALNPMLWLCGIVSLPCYGLAFLLGEGALSIAFVVIGSTPIAATICGFFYFMLVAPEKLQSEEYQIRHEAMELIKQKGTSVEISPVSVEAVANPGYVALPGTDR